MTRREHVVVVGNGVAGFACARGLHDAGVDVTLVGPGLPYDRPPLSKRALTDGGASPLATIDGLRALGIRHVDGLASDPATARRRVTVHTAEGASLDIAYDHLVWATGLRSARPPIPGIEHAHGNSHPADLEQLIPRLSTPRRRVVVIGAGLIGTETAATLAQAHRVTLVDVDARPLGRLHPRISSAASAALHRRGVRFLGSCSIQRLDRSAAGFALATDAGIIDADTVICATGMRSTLPAVLGPSGLADADERLRLPAHDRVWVCGDLARYPHPRYGRISVPHWDTARAAGAHVAASILGATERFVREPYWFSDIAGTRVQQVGVPQAAQDWADDGDATIGYDADGRPVCVVLVNAPTRLHEARRLLAA